MHAIKKLLIIKYIFITVNSECNTNQINRTKIIIYGINVIVFIIIIIIYTTAPV